MRPWRVRVARREVGPSVRLPFVLAMPVKASSLGQTQVRPLAAFWFYLMSHRLCGEGGGYVDGGLGKLTVPSVTFVRFRPRTKEVKF